jgi:hypothetical protein
VGVQFIVDKATYLNDVNKKLQGKHKDLLCVFSGKKSFEAKLNLLHKHIYKHTHVTFRPVEIFCNLPPHQTIGIR